MIETEDRKIIRNWKEFLLETRESLVVYGWVWRELIGPESKYYLRKMMLASLVSMLLYVVQPGLIGALVDNTVNKETRKTYVVLVLIAVCFVAERVFLWLVGHYREYLFGANMGQIDRRMNTLFFEKSIGQHMNRTDELSAANVEKGRARIMDLENMFLFEGIPSLLSLFISFTLLWILSPMAGLAMMLVLGNYLVWMVFLNRRVINVCTPLDKAFRALNRHRTDRWDAVSRVKTSGKEEAEVTLMDTWFMDILREDRRFWLWYTAMANIRDGLRIVAQLFILCYGIWSVWNGSWGIGTLLPVISWSQMVANDLWRIGHIQHRLDWNMPPVRAMMQALTIEPDVVDAPDAIVLPENGQIRIEFDQVSHAYPGNTDVIRKATFTIEPGEKVALVGPSGAGKTTLVNLLLRAMDPQEGEICINGIPLTRIRLSSWIHRIGCIAQKPEVFAGTLRDNMLYGLDKETKSRITDEELWEIMREFQIDFGERLTDGLDTRVGKEGIELSGGQKQRLMIGAAMIKKPDVLLIDEATCSLDSTTERKVQSALQDILKNGGRSALIIAHRLDTVRFCNKIVVLRPVERLINGDPQVEYIGSSFADAYTHSPTFRRLADDQGVKP